MSSAAPPATVSEIQPRAPLSVVTSGYWLPLSAAWLFGAVYIWIFLLRQWVPHDEGAFADMADRILRGELPHRDYLDLYTGGLACLHAFAWKVFGRELAAFRYVLYAFALAWLPALYYIATRFVRPVIAAALVLIAVTWSIPNYPAAVPSWYNLFFATWGTAALLRYMETRTRRWLFIAGLCGGFSFLAKVSGLFFVFAAVWFLVFLNQESESPRHSQLAGLLRGAAVAIVAIAVVRIISGWLTARTLAYFVLPNLIVAGVLLAREFRCIRSRQGGSGGEFLRDLSIFGAGVTVPIATFLLQYVHGGITEFIRGVFILPARRMQFAQADPPPVWAIAVAAGVWGLCFLLLSSRRKALILGGSAVLLALVVASYSQDWALQSIWQSLAAAVPLVALALALWFRTNAGVFLLVAVVCLCSLVQFPFSVPIYFCYVVPLVVAAAATMCATRLRATKVGAAVVLAFFLYAGIALLNTGDIYTMANDVEHPAVNAHLSASGAQELQVLPQQATSYNAMVPLIQQHARGEFIYAGPSAPEIYFLSGHRNPARWTFDFFDDRSADPAFISSMLEVHHVDVVVVNVTPDFDPAPTPEMIQMYTRLYPHAQRFGHFVVRWRE